jgi:hypothetical protein
MMHRERARPDAAVERTAASRQSPDRKAQPGQPPRHSASVLATIRSCAARGRRGPYRRTQRHLFPRRSQNPRDRRNGTALRLSSRYMLVRPGGGNAGSAFPNWRSSPQRVPFAHLWERAVPTCPGIGPWPVRLPRAPIPARLVGRRLDRCLALDSAKLLAGPSTCGPAMTRATDRLSGAVANHVMNHEVFKWRRARGTNSIGLVSQGISTRYGVDL